MSIDNIDELRRKHYNASIVYIREVNPDLRIIRVRPDFPVPPHRPGQYGTLGLGYWEPRAPDCQEEGLAPNVENRMVRRAYSLSSSILDDRGELFPSVQSEWVEFYIVLVRKTESPDAPALTPRLFLLGENDRLFFGPKITGHYTTHMVSPTDNVVFLATGTGEAPHNYMVWELLKNGHQGRILSVCCVRYAQDLGYLHVHKQLMDRFSNYKYVSLTTREPGTSKKVYIQDLITSGQLGNYMAGSLDPANTHVFLCGNPKMIGVPLIDRNTGQKVYPSPVGVIQLLEERGFRADQMQPRVAGNIHFEQYW